MLCRVVQTVFRQRDASQVLVCGEVVRLYPESVAIAPDCSGSVACDAEGGSQGDIPFRGGFGTRRDCLSQPVYGFLMSASLMQKQSQQIEGLGVPGLLRDDRPVQRLGLRQAPRIMVRHSGAEGFFQPAHERSISSSA